MPFASGETLTAAKLNRVQPVTYAADASATLTLTATEADIAGATVTFSTTAANAIYVVRAAFDCFINTVSGVKTIQGRVAVDGVTASKEALFTDNFTGARATVTQQWRGTLAAAGSHTIKLRGKQDSAGGTYQIIAGNTSLVVEIFEAV